MKIRFLPPRYLDSVSLLEEHEFVRSILEEKHVEPAYVGYHSFLFLRGQMIENELDLRKVRYGQSLETELLDDDESSFPFFLEDINSDVEEVMSFWEENFDLDVGKLVEQLALASPFELYKELVWLFKIYRSEYEL